MKKISARISDSEDGLYLIIENDKENDSVAFAIKKEEIKPIKLACEQWLKKT